MTFPVAASIPLAAVLVSGVTPAFGQSVQFSPPAPFESGTYGKSVDTQGSLAFVGHPKSQTTPPTPGEVHVYENQSGLWTLIETLSPGTGQNNDEFGARLAVNRSFLAVGAPGHNPGNGAQPPGAVYVYRRDPNGWTLEQTIHPPTVSGGTIDRFGLDVDIDGDTLVVGSAGNDFATDQQGRAFAYRWINGAWTLETQLVPMHDVGQIISCFGEAVAIYQNRVLVGASENTVLIEPGRPGAVFPFARAAGSWIEEPTIYPPVSGATSEAHFGFGLDMDGRHAVIGAYQYYLDNPTGQQIGAAFAYELDALDNWTYVGEVGSGVTTPLDAFGYAIDVAGQNLIVGAPGYGASAVQSGAAHFFTLSGGAWTHTTTHIPSQAQDTDRFGEIVACDVYVVAGAPETDGTSTTNSGAAYVTVP